MEWLYPTCAVEGCSSLSWLENDHRVDWAKSHTTVLDLLDRLCSHHHDLKTSTDGGWSTATGNDRSSHQTIRVTLGTAAPRRAQPEPNGRSGTKHGR